MRFGFLQKNVGHIRVVLQSCICLVLVGLAVPSNAQMETITAEDAVRIALENNMQIQAAHQRVDQCRHLESTALELEKTVVGFNYDENNIALNGLPLSTIGLSQDIEYPSIYRARRRVLEGQTRLALDQSRILERVVTKETLKAYYQVVYWEEILTNYEILDSLLPHVYAGRMQELPGKELDRLEQLNAESKRQKMDVRMAQAEESVRKAYVELGSWMQVDSSLHVADMVLMRLPLPDIDSMVDPGMQYRESAVHLAEKDLVLRRRELLPDFNLTIFEGLNRGEGKQAYTGFQVGIGVPLSYGAQKSRINAARTAQDVARSEKEDYHVRSQAAYQVLLSEVRKWKVDLDFWDTSGRQLSEEIITDANRALAEDEIDLLQYFLYVEGAKDMLRDYLIALREYNIAVLELKYFTL